MSGHQLVAQGIHKSFGEEPIETHVLHDLDLTIDPGEFVAIMGPSGSGKSTLLYCLSGMDTVNGGTVRLGDHEITALSQADLAALRLGAMGFVFQQVHLLRNLSILDNVVLPGVASTPRRREAVVERALALLERTGIAELADRDITEVSGGQLQRAAIARALINSPGILFGDEPTGALNTAAAGQIMDLLTEINEEGRTVVLVTHDPNVAARTRRVVVLGDGVIVGDLRRGASETADGWTERLAGWLTTRT